VGFLLFWFLSGRLGNILGCLISVLEDIASLELRLSGHIHAVLSCSTNAWGVERNYSLAMANLGSVRVQILLHTRTWTANIASWQQETQTLSGL